MDFEFVFWQAWPSVFYDPFVCSLIEKLFVLAFMMLL